MCNKNRKLTICMLISAALLASGSVPAMAAENTDVAAANLISNVQTVSETNDEDLSEVAKAVQNKIQEKKEEYKNLGVAQVEGSYLNVREEATTDSDIVGRMEHNSVATVVGESGDWYAIQSGDITGYVKKEYLTVGDKSLIDSVRDENGDFTYATEPKKTGVSVIDYALQFVGNPYVYGGSSLTNGTDCSGFVMSVYANFGISLPHSSSALRSVGTAVSYSEAQPGDIICYSGHVGLYIGNGQIVHASTPSGGIKVSSATFKSIITVRRIFN